MGSFRDILQVVTDTVSAVSQVIQIAANPAATVYNVISGLVDYIKKAQAGLTEEEVAELWANLDEWIEKLDALPSMVERIEIIEAARRAQAEGSET